MGPAAIISPQDVTEGLNIDKANATLYWKLRRFEKAAPLAEKVLEESPEDEVMIAVLCGCYVKMGLTDKAEAMREKILGKKDGGGELRDLLVAMELKAAAARGDYAEVLSVARSHLPRAELEQNKELLCILYKNISDACCALDRYKEAAEAQRKAAELDPEDKRAQMLVIVQEMNVAIEEKSHAELEQLAALGIRRSRELEYTDLLPTFYRNRFKALKKLGKVEEAVTVAKEAVAQFPAVADFYAFLSDTLKDIDRHEEALEAQEKYVELEPENEHAKIVLASRLKKLLEILEIKS